MQTKLRLVVWQQCDDNQQLGMLHIGFLIRRQTWYLQSRLVLYEDDRGGAPTTRRPGTQSCGLGFIGREGYATAESGDIRPVRLLPPVGRRPEDLGSCHSDNWYPALRCSVPAPGQQVSAWNDGSALSLGSLLPQLKAIKLCANCLTTWPDTF